MLNRTVGLGVFEPAAPDAVDWTIAQYRQRRVSRAFIAVTEGAQPGHLAEQLLSRRLSEARAWTKFVRPPEPAAPARSTLRVAPLDQANASDWGRIVSSAFDMPASTAPLLARLLPTLPVGSDGRSSSRFFLNGTNWQRGTQRVRTDSS